jgi:RES domain-containing protein
MDEELIAFRVANFEAPLWNLPHPQGGRYNDRNSAPTQYLALHPLTPWAEVLRNSARTTAEQARGLRVALWVLRVSLEQEPLDLTYDNAADWGLDPEDLVADDQGPCRDLAQRLRDDPDLPTILIAPSVALPGTRNLVILEERVDIDYHREPIDLIDLPVALGAQDGHAAEGLWQLVHHRGSPLLHPELEAWQHGDEYEFDQPTPVFAP